MQTSEEGMREIAQGDKQKAAVVGNQRRGRMALTLGLAVASVGAVLNKPDLLPQLMPVEYKQDKSGNIVISGKNRKNSAQASGRRSVMKVKLAAKREKAKHRRWQERMAAGGAR